MKQNVTITMRGAGEAYAVRGVLERTNAGACLIYDEPEALGLGRVTTALALLPDGSAVLTRTGAVRCAFRFAAGQTHSAFYETPHGSFPAEVTTHALRTELDEDGGLIDLRYALTFGGAADEHRLSIAIRTEEEA